MRKKILFIAALLCTMIIGSTAVSLANETYDGVEYYLHYSPYRGVDKCIDTRFNNYLIMDGVDVSEYQETIDWAAVKKSGIDYAIIRVGFRGYGAAGNMVRDTYFTQNMANAKANGVMIGIYIFSQAINEAEAKAEADQAIAWLESAGYNAKDLALPVVMDYEFAGGSDGRMYDAGLTASNNQAVMTPIAKAFCDEVKAKGYKAGFYGNYGMYNSHVNFYEMGANILPWYAQYNRFAERASNCPYEMWQYNSDAYVSGINGKVDIDFWFLDPNKTATTDKSIANCTIDVGTNGYFQYLGDTRPHEPSVVVTDKDKELVYGKDYGVGYFKNVSTGTAYAYVYGEGEYSDYKLAPFQIVSIMPAVEEDLTPPEEGDLTSEEYKIGEYITGLDWNTTYETLKQNLKVNDKYTLKAVNKNGKELEDSAVIGTGTRVNIYNGDEVKSSILVAVKADGTGDGVILANDAMMGLRIIAGSYSSNKAQRAALDVDGNGAVDAVDVMMILRHLAKTYTITK